MMLKDKVAIVTGGGRGIGKAIAYEFAKEGAKIMLCSRSEDELKKAAKEIYKINKAAEYCVADVSDGKSVDTVMKKTISKFGGIDILVTAAGIYGPMGKFHKQDIKKWKEALEINLMGTVNCVHAAIPYLQKKGGSVIALAGAGVPSAFPGFSAYSTSKAGVVQFITTIAAEYNNIRLNSIAPGPVATKLIDEVLAAGPDVVGKEFYEKNLEWKKGKGGSVSPDVAAKFVAYLCSDKCKLTGKYLSAVWDKELEDVSADLYTLRRIDGRNYAKKQ